MLMIPSCLSLMLLQTFFRLQNLIQSLHTFTTHTHTPNADLAKDFFIDGEGEVQDVSNVVVFHPLQRLVKLLIQILQIRQVCCPVGNSQLTSTIHQP